MTRKDTRWPIWKIAAATAMAVLAAIILLWLSVILEGVPERAAEPGARQSALTLPALLLMFGVGAAILAVLGGIWLGLRIREARTPVWKRKKHKRR